MARGKPTLNLLAGVILFAGCTSPAGPAAKEEAAKAPPVASAVAVSVRVADGGALKQALEKLRGQVVLVDFWATWCEPCRQRFPHVVALHRELGGKGFAAVSVSLDDPENEAAVLKFLREQQAAFDNLLSRFGTGTRSADEFDVRGDVPLYKLYDRAGRLRYQFSADPAGLEHGQPLEKLDEAVRRLVAER